jgi:poly(3-hydroxybutyrate) depolymerase
MIYQAYLAQNDSAARIRAVATLAAKVLGRPDREHHIVIRRLAAAYELVARSSLIHERPAFGIKKVKVRGRDVEVREEVVDATPFAKLLHFAKSSETAEPLVLLVAPLSGHFATLLRGTIRTLLSEHDVYVTDWQNARDISVRNGRFDLDDFIGHLIRFTEVVGFGAHIIAVCQPCVAVIAAVAILAESGNHAQPRSMTLMAGPVDTRINPTRVNELATAR